MRSPSLTRRLQPVALLVNPHELRTSGNCSVIFVTTDSHSGAVAPRIDVTSRSVGGSSLSKNALSATEATREEGGDCPTKLSAWRGVFSRGEPDAALWEFFDLQ